MTHRDPSQQRQHSHRVEDHLVDLEKFPEIIKILLHSLHTTYNNDMCSEIKYIYIYISNIANT